MSSRLNKHNRRLLRSLLVPFVQEWGVGELEEVIREIALSSSATSDKESPENANVSSRSDRRPNAVSIVERLDVIESRKRALLTIANQYDQKTFLPSLSDVRNFLEMRGRDQYGLKHRPDAFRKVLKVLLDLREDSLLKLIDSEAYSGPSQLGPLSSAIRDSSVSLRPSSHVTPDDKSQTVSAGSKAESHKKTDNKDT